MKTVSNDATRRAWVEVDSAALARNGRSLAAHLRPGSRLLPMIKADGYGLGAARAVRALAPLDPVGFGVATADEGTALRRAGWAGRVVVFAPCAPLDAERIARERLEPAVTELAALAAFGAAATAVRRAIPVHVEVDTGMGRCGLGWREADGWAPRVAAALARQPLRLASTFTHFHSAEDGEATREQWRRFEAALAAMRAAGVDPGLRHACNSAAILGFPEMHADLVRPGIFLYGGTAWRRGGGTAVPEPVAALRARVACVREAAAGSTVSYGATWRAEAPARLASLAVGYGDGLRRELSNRGSAIVRGRRAPVRGAVCMDTTVVDVTGIDGVEAGDVATLLGREGREEIGVDEMAAWCGTIPYEILTGLTTRLPRVDAA